MKKLTSDQIRDDFINFFKENGHTHVQSSSLLPHNDPSLMFVNSGMVQFKNVFTGLEEPGYTTATSSQKCIRAGGKHNDLDNVGYTARHHTFFEMLGNFSFGDYFKEEAIYYVWDILIKHFSLDKDKLYITVYHDDIEAKSLWKKISGFSESKIIPISTKDNFWSMGETGPCGPCSEVFYDHGSHIDGGLPGTADEDGDRFVEIWNLVFMQFEQIDNDTRIALPKKSVDTGMGLERISAVIRGVHNNYETDLFKNLIEYAESILKIKAHGDSLFSYRVLADHLRSSSHLIADGVIPSNEGRGYVLRRIIRRATRHAHYLNTKEPVLHKLLPHLIETSRYTFPELVSTGDLISSTLEQEESRFKATLERGLDLLKKESTNIKSNILPGEIAFKLYDTYGFPLDLTQDVLRDKNILVDIKKFNESMQIQKDNSKKSWIGSGEKKDNKIWFDILLNHGATEFLGYNFDSTQANVLELIKDSHKLDTISNIESRFILIANQTPFYGESGGQVGDIGIVESSKCKIEVIDTLRYVDKIIGHICILHHGKISVGDNIKLEINKKHRAGLKIHHTATHILHTTLKNILGKQVTQQGSLVTKNKLRFDANNPISLTHEQITKIEKEVNHIIRGNFKVTTSIMSRDDAIAKSAIALFSEKYENEVRVVSLDKGSRIFSMELCGGTHVERTGDIGLFKIVSESAISSGIRRIEAVCGEYALEFTSNNDTLIKDAMSLLKSTKTELMQKIGALLEKNKNLQGEITKLKIESLKPREADKITTKSNEVTIIYKEVEADQKTIRIVINETLKKHSNLIAIYSTRIKDKALVVIGVSNAIPDQYNASIIAKNISDFLDGNGGGSKTFAQIACKKERISELRRYLKESII